VGLTTNCAPALENCWWSICGPQSESCVTGTKSENSEILFSDASESERINVRGPLSSTSRDSGVPHPGPTQFPEGSPLCAVKTKRDGDQTEYWPAHSPACLTMRGRLRLTVTVKKIS